MTSKLQKHKYVTRQPHGEHPAGTECLAWREIITRMYSEVCLQFGEEIIHLPGWQWYLEGIEQRPYTVWDSMREAIAKEIDEEVLGSLDVCLKKETNDG